MTHQFYKLDLYFYAPFQNLKAKNYRKLLNLKLLQDYRNKNRNDYQSNRQNLSKADLKPNRHIAMTSLYYKDVP